MELAVSRKLKQGLDTIGNFLASGNKMSNCLELPVPSDGNYTHGFCIAPGRYQVQIVFSPALQCAVPQLVNVPGRSYIEIHWGNAAKDTHGCILTGDYTGGENWIGHSVDEFNVLMDILGRAVERKEEIWITITEDF
jgi:hypothetical protein